MAWGKASTRLIGVADKPGPSGDTPSLGETAREAGVSENTARNRMKLAEDLEPYPDTAQRVDAGGYYAPRRSFDVEEASKVKARAFFA